MQLAAAIPPDDRGLQYGEGLFETLRVQDHHAPLLARHQARMLAGCIRLGLPVSEAEVRARLDAAVAASEPGARVVKVMVTGGSAGRGYAPARRARPRWVVQEFPLTLRPPALYRSGLVTGLCCQRLARQPALAGIKHLNRLEQVAAAREVLEHGWDEGLMLDSLGRPVEWTSMNLFARFGDRLWTPALAHQGVSGVLRSWLLEHWLPGSPLTADHRPRPLADLRHADELFAGNSVAGFLPVRKLAVWRWDKPELVLSLQHTFSGLFGH